MRELLHVYAEAQDAQQCFAKGKLALPPPFVRASVSKWRGAAGAGLLMGTHACAEPTHIVACRLLLLLSIETHTTLPMMAASLPRLL